METGSGLGRFGSTRGLQGLCRGISKAQSRVQMWASEIIVLMISIYAENQWIRSWKMKWKLNFYGVMPR